MSDSRRLDVLLDGDRAGLITADASGRLTFTYDEAWRSRRSPTPLTAQLPDALAAVAGTDEVKELRSSLPRTLVDRVAVRAKRCRKALQG